MDMNLCTSCCIFWGMIKRQYTTLYSVIIGSLTLHDQNVNTKITCQCNDRRKNIDGMT